MTVPSDKKDLRRVVVIVALLKLAYFGVEFAVARAIGSVSLFAESVHFLPHHDRLPTDAGPVSTRQRRQRPLRSHCRTRRG